MLIVETIGRIRREHFVQGKTISEIARDLKLQAAQLPRRHRIGHLVFEARLWSGALHLARARPLQSLRLVLGRRLQPRPLRPP